MSTHTELLGNARLPFTRIAEYVGECIAFEMQWARLIAMAAGHTPGGQTRIFPKFVRASDKAGDADNAQPSAATSAQSLGRDSAHITAFATKRE